MIREDADFIFDLRRDPRVATYINETSDVQLHCAWMAQYFERESDYYFVVADLAGTPQGTCALYNFSADGRDAEWGRWVISPRSLAGTESAYLSYSIAFEHLGLERVVCRTISQNSHTLAFHEACGLIVNGIEHDAVKIGEHLYDIVEHMITSPIWSKLKPLLRRRCVAVSSILNRRTTGAISTKEVGI